MLVTIFFVCVKTVSNTLIGAWKWKAWLNETDESWTEEQEMLAGNRQKLFRFSPVWTISMGGAQKKKKVCAYHLPRRKVEVPQPWVVHMCACLSLARSRRVRRGAVPSWAKLLPDPSVWQPHGKNMCPWHCISCSLRRLDWNRPRSRPSYCKPVHLYVSSWWRSPWAAWCGPGNLVPEKNMKIFNRSFIYDSISHSHNDKRKGYLDM